MGVFRGISGRASSAAKVLFGTGVGATALGLLKSEFEKKGLEGILKSIKALDSGKGLNDQHVFGLILSQANLSLKKRELLLGVIREMRMSGNQEDRQTADNFVISVCLGVASEDGTYPGSQTIKSLMDRVIRLGTEDEMKRVIRLHIQEVGNDARAKTKFDAVRMLLSKYGVTVSGKVSGSVSSKIDKLNSFLNEREQAIKAEEQAYENISWFRKLFM